MCAERKKTNRTNDVAGKGQEGVPAEGPPQTATQPETVVDGIISTTPTEAVSRPPTQDLQPEVPPAPLMEPCAVISTHEERITVKVHEPQYYRPPPPPPQDEAPYFMLPLHNTTVNDGDRAVFRVFFRGTPTPRLTWYFNSQPVKPSADFQINIDVQRGESSLVILEVFPEDEGEYMCKAENPLGAAVTRCHLFVKCKYWLGW